MSIYFDHNATTFLRPEAEAGWLQVVREAWGNPASVHGRGQAAHDVLDGARRRLAGLFGCEPGELVFNSGATEGANHVLQALLKQPRAPGTPLPHAIVSGIEHHCVLQPAQAIHKSGQAQVDFIDADPDGRVALAKIQAKLRPDTLVVALMAVNNETGVIQDIPGLVKLLAEYNRAHAAEGAQVGLFCDATQAYGKLDPAFVAGADWINFSGHKFGAPKGVGGLICRRELPRFFHGGNAEHARRPGTVAVEAVAALAAAFEAGEHHRVEHVRELTALRDRFETGVRAAVPTAVVTGAAAPRVCNTSFIGFVGLRAEVLVMSFDLAGLCVSTGAACVQGAAQSSHVLASMHLPPEQIAGAIRFSLGEGNTAKEVDQAIEIVRTVSARLTRA